MNIQSQDLNQHRWENRLIVILFYDFDDPDLKRQLKEFKNFESGLKERKVIVYQITPEKFKRGRDDKVEWMDGSDNLFSKYKSDKSRFEVLLVGLDGGTKLRIKEPIGHKEIFRIIDSMPMRRREMERQNRKNG